MFVDYGAINMPFMIFFCRNVGKPSSAYGWSGGPIALDKKTQIKKKKKKKKKKRCFREIFFLFLQENIYCGYSLEVPL